MHINFGRRRPLLSTSRVHAKSDNATGPPFHSSCVTCGVVNLLLVMENSVPYHMASHKKEGGGRGTGQIIRAA